MKEVQSQHSDYVDFLLRQLQSFSQQVGRTAAAVPLTADLHRLLWTLAVKIASGIFVEGFAAAKKCTNEGRALMQLDYRQFVLKTEAMSGLRPLPYQAGLEKNVFFFKPSPVVFLGFLVFWVFFWFFGFFYIFAQKKEEFLGFFSFKNTFRCIQTLNYNHSY